MSQSRATINPVVDTYVFARAKWETEGSLEHGDYSIRGIPGTWAHIAWPSQEIAEKIHAVACCPNCHQLTVLAKGQYDVDRLGHLEPSYFCRYADEANATCGFHRDAFLDEWSDGKVLYAVSYHGPTRIEIVYTHAKTTVEARAAFHFLRGADIIAIGRAVGFAGPYVDSLTLAHAERIGS